MADNYVYAVARIRSLETALFTESVIGQLLASMRYLADRWMWSTATVYRYLQTLRNAPRNSIRIQIETTVETGKTLITICDFDRWYFEMPNRETADETDVETARETPDETLVERKNSNTERNKDNNTPVNDNVGGMGGVSDVPEVNKARELLAWIAANVPGVARMPEPLTEQNAVWMVRRYDVEDIRRIIATMQSKGAHLRNSNAYATFVNYAKLDIALRRKRAVKGYSYAEYCDMVCSRAFLAEDFVSRQVDGRRLWFKRQDIAAAE